MSNTQPPADILEAAEAEYTRLQLVNDIDLECAPFNTGYIKGATAERDRDKWVKVEDGLPEYDTWVLVYKYKPDYECCMTMALYISGTWIPEDNVITKPTHWQPLPNKPIS